jgi:ligand-binding SRPBCC domain-containing protein
MRLQTAIWLPAARDDVFRFFSDAANLQALTPSWVHFRMLTRQPIAMEDGTLIDYRIRVHGIPIRWQSRITRWDPPRGFVDEQTRGPYRRWVHTHTFAEDRGGTTVGDSVEFDVAFGFLAGRFVMRDVRRIFAYRQDVLLRLFPS